MLKKISEMTSATAVNDSDLVPIVQQGANKKVTKEILLTDNNLNTTNKKISAAINEVNSIAKGANQAISYGNYSTMVTAFNSLASDIYNVGQNVMIITLEVPDLWISGIESTSSPYTYTTDEAFTTALETDGYVQVGYYKLSALETQKVDLTNYATIPQVNTGLAGKVDKTSIVSSVSASSTNEQIPGAKLFYDTVGNLETILETLDTGNGVV